MPTLLQGDVFDHASGPAARLVLVFGYVGFNLMGKRWMDFAGATSPFADVTDPFLTYDQPVQVGRHWLRFVAAHDHASPELVVRSLLDAIALAREHRVGTIVTNGAGAAVPPAFGKDEKRRLADCRARWLMTLCAELESTHGVQWTLTSLDDVFIRNGWAIGQL